MAGIAKVTLIGNLGGDPETRYTPGGKMNVQFSLAVSRRWTDQSGQQQERTTWFRVTGWGRTAESMDSLTQSGALAKGRQVFVSGSIESREFQDRSGNTRTSLDVSADEFQLLGSRQDGGGAGGGMPRGGGDEGPGDLGGGIDPEDVPF